ncbi:MAG: SRPBCC family protein [Myxococcota bacterium]
MNTTAQLELDRLIRAPISQVFAACTRAELMAEWLICADNGVAEANNDLRVGGQFCVTMRRGEQVIGSAHGTYLTIQEPHRVSFTWSSENVGVRDSIVTIELVSVPGGTHLTLRQTLDPRSAAGARHAHGWTVSLSRLTRLLEPNPSCIDPNDSSRNQHE